MKNYSLSIVIPALNEQENIENTCIEIHKVFKEINIKYEILIVDDGSTDNTFVIAKKLSNKSKNIKVFRHQKNLGFGAAYRTGSLNANKTHVIMIPGDNAHPAEGLLPIIKEIGTKDIIIPYPKNPNARSIIRRVISKLFVSIFNIWFGMKLNYYNGLVLHRADYLKKTNQKTNGFAYQAEILVKLINSGATFKEIPVKIKERESGSSRAFRFKNLCQIISCFLYLTYKIWLNAGRKIEL